jgi:ribosomal protein S6
LNTYDALMIVPGAVADEDLERVFGQVRDEVARLNGSVLRAEKVGKRGFARPLKKQQGGVYARVGFTLDPDSVDALRGWFSLNEDVFRVQVTRAEAASPEKGPEPSEAGKKEESSHGKSESSVSGG